MRESTQPIAGDKLCKVRLSGGTQAPQIRCFIVDSHILSQFGIFRRDLLREIAKAAGSRHLDAFFRDKAVSRVSSVAL